MAHVIANRVTETSTSTGTGDFTLSGAVTGHKTLASRCSVNDTVDYVIEAVDAGGAPSGEWEVGIGTYSAANTLTRTTVQESSNSDALVSFSAGNKRVFISPTAARASWTRGKLSANKTYYVRTDGSDSNSGLANTSGGAFLTIQKAVNTISDTIDLGGYDVTIQVADGTYTGAVVLRKIVGRGTVTIQGNTGNLSSVIINTTSATCITNTSERISIWTIRYLKLTTTTSGNCIYCGGGSGIHYNNIDFGAASGSGHHIMIEQGGKVQANGNYTISGNAYSHVTSSGAGSEWRHTGADTVTISGSPTLTVFVIANGNSSALGVSVTYSGTITCKRYDVTLNSVINSYGSGANYFPGTVAGTTATGGLYN